MPDEVTPDNQELREWFHNQRERALELQRENYERRLEDAIAILECKIGANHELASQIAVAQKEAIDKAEVASEKRFESINEFRRQLRDQQDKFLTRELFDQFVTEQRRRQDATLELAQALSLRITEIEARGGGEKDQAADLKASLSIAIAAIAVILSAGIGLLSLLYP